jgi:hypothetical protein
LGRLPRWCARTRAGQEASPGARRPAAILGDLILAAWKLGGTGLIAVGISGLVALLMNLAFGRAFTGQAPPGVSFGKADCAHWMRLWPGAHTCATAAMLEASSDAVVLRVGAGLLGAGLLVAYGLVRDMQRRRGRGPVVVLAGYFPLLAAGVFGAGALGLTLAQLTGFGVTQGPGTYLSGAIVAAAAVAWYGPASDPAPDAGMGALRQRPVTPLGREPGPVRRSAPAGAPTRAGPQERTKTSPA